MSRDRKELLRGLRALIRETSREMEDLVESTGAPESPDPSAAVPQAPDTTPGQTGGAPAALETLLRKSAPPPDVPEPAPAQAPAAPGDGAREAPANAPAAAPAAPAPPAPPEAPVREAPPAPAHEAPPVPARGGYAAALADLSRLQAKKGVCWAYFANPQCWEVSEAPCNTALHVCMLRQCPVFFLHREELERRFAGRFKHLY